VAAHSADSASTCAASSPARCASARLPPQRLARRRCSGGGLGAGAGRPTPGQRVLQSRDLAQPSNSCFQLRVLFPRRRKWSTKTPFMALTKPPRVTPLPNTAATAGAASSGAADLHVVSLKT
jgi:hypothetical protein